MTCKRTVGQCNGEEHCGVAPIGVCSYLQPLSWGVPSPVTKQRLLVVVVRVSSALQLFKLLYITYRHIHSFVLCGWLWKLPRELGGYIHSLSQQALSGLKHEHFLYLSRSKINYDVLQTKQADVAFAQKLLYSIKLMILYLRHGN